MATRKKKNINIFLSSKNSQNFGIVLRQLKQAGEREKKENLFFVLVCSFIFLQYIRFSLYFESSATNFEYSLINQSVSQSVSQLDIGRSNFKLLL